jgi:FkbM family methyltransferase
MARIIELLRRIGAQPWLLPLTALMLRSRTVRQSPAFVARELCGSNGCFRYELRQFPGRYVLVRHGTGDVVTVGEVFHTRDYSPPAELGALFGERGPQQILDLGANVGYAGAYFSALWPESQITAYEPDPANAAVHERLISVDAAASTWRLVRAAAGNTAGEAQFVAGGVALSRIAAIGGEPAAGERLITVPIADVLPELCGADLVKIDIEGGEWALLRDSRFAANPPRALVMEYHPEGCGEASASHAARRLLEQAGLTVVDSGAHDQGVGTLWAWSGE